MAKGKNPLTEQEKKEALRMRYEGMQYKYISTVLKKTIGQIASYVTWYQKNTDKRYVKPILFVNKPYEPTGREMPPSYPASGITTICLPPEEVETGLIRQYGKRLSPITMALSDRRGTAANIIGSIY